MNRIPLQTSVSIPRTSNSPKLLTSSLPVYSTLLPRCGGSLSVGFMVISQRVVTAFPTASDPLWTHGFNNTGNLVFPRFNVLQWCEGSLSVGSRKVKTVTENSALHSEVSLSPNKSFVCKPRLCLISPDNYSSRERRNVQTRISLPLARRGGKH